MKIAYSGWCLYRGTIASTSDTTGALVVAGGVGISGRLYVAANLDAPSITRRDHNDLWYDFNRNDIYTDTYR
jgi:hypothetical protein